MRDGEVIEMNAPGAGWFADPMQRHQLRYWSGQEWTEHVSDNGQVSVDALGSSTASQYQPQGQYQPQAQYPQAQYPQAQYQPQGQYQPQAQYPQAQYPQAQPQGWPPTPAVAPATPAAGSQVGLVTLGGAALAGIGAAVDWMGQGGFTANGFDIPALFLADYQTDSEPGLAVGHLAALLAVALLVAAFLGQPTRRTLTLVAGIALVAIGLLFLVQLQRATSSADETLFDYLQLGPFAVIAGGVVAIVARGR